MIVYIIKLCLVPEIKLPASMVALLYVAKTRFSEFLFEDSKLYMSAMDCLFCTLPVGGIWVVASLTLIGALLCEPSVSPS